MKPATPPILVTPRSLTRDGHPALRRLEAAGYALRFAAAGRQPGPEELRQLLPGCVGYLCGVERVDADVLRCATALRVLSRNGTGIDNVDVEAARRMGIQVRRTEGANARGVAELTLALILALIRSVPWSDAGLKQGKWERREGVEVAGRTLGLVGCGRVGRLVAKFALALDLRVLAYDPFPDQGFAPGAGFAYGPLDGIWPHADVVSLHCPGPRDAAPLVDADVLAQLKPGAYLVNTARASLVDEVAVLAALERGPLAGFATDVFAVEPPGDSPWLRHPKVIATPHLGGFTRESVSRAVEGAVDNLLAVLESPIT